jgi:hypothetical protein
MLGVFSNAIRNGLLETLDVFVQQPLLFEDHGACSANWQL